MKRSLALLVVAVMLFASCGQGAAPTGSTTENSTSQPASVSQPEGTAFPSDLRFTFVNPVVGAPYWNLVDNGVKDAAEELGIDVSIVGPSTVDVNQQIEYFESAVAAQADGIVTMALVATSFEPVIDAAIDKGVPVVLLDGDAPNSKRIAYYGSNNYNGGVTLANRIIEDMGEEFTYAILTYDLAADNANERIDGLRSVLDQYENIEFLAIEESKDDMVVGADKTVSLMQANNMDIDVLIGVGSKDTPCICLGLEDLGVTGQVAVYGMDAGLDQTLDFIRDGSCKAALQQDPYKMGYMSIHALYDIVVNNEYPEQEVNDTGMLIVDQSNVDQ